MVGSSCFLLRAANLGDYFRPKTSVFTGEFIVTPWKETFSFLEHAALSVLNRVSLDFPELRACGSVEVDSFA